MSQVTFHIIDVDTDNFVSNIPCDQLITFNYPWINKKFFVKTYHLLILVCEVSSNNNTPLQTVCLESTNF